MAGWTPLLGGSGPRDFDEYRPGDLGSPIDTGYKSYPDDIPLVASPRADSQLSSPTFYRDSPKTDQRRSTKTSSAFYAQDRPDEPYEYHYRKTRAKIFLIGFGEWLLTVALCGAIIGSLKFYEGVRETVLLSTYDTKWFNALTIALSLALGFNLASSLKSYAAMLRWVLLTRQWYTLEIFDLILGCTGQSKLFELAFKTFPWVRSKRLGLGKNPSKMICGMALLWILVNLGAQAAVASLSLFWPTEPSPNGVLLSKGNVTVLNFESWIGGHLVPEQNFDWDQRQQSGAVNQWGLQGQYFTESPYISFEKETEGRQTVYWKPGEFWEYRFEDRNEAGDTFRWSNRYVRTSTKCETFPFLEYNIGFCSWPKDEIPNPDLDSYPAEGLNCYSFKKGNMNISHVLPLNVGDRLGSTIYRAERVQLYNPNMLVKDPYSPLCGPRCNQVQVFQATQPPGGGSYNGTYMECNTTMSDIMEHDPMNPDFINLSEENRNRISINDTNARLGAGSIGLQETFHLGSGWTTVDYGTSSRWNLAWPNVTITTEIMEKTISRFAIGAVAAFADQGPRFLVTDQLNMPSQAQYLAVDWTWMYALTGSICGVQLVALLILMAFGNKAIVRDDGAWSMARLLMPVVSKLSEGSSIMPNKDISHAKVFEGERIAYGVREGAESNSIDILWRSKDKLRRTAMQPGRY